MIEILVFLIAILAVGSYKKDFTTLILSGMGFMAYGLMLFNTFELSYPYNFQFGILAICFGFYVSFRSAVDLITNKKKEEKK